MSNDDTTPTDDNSIPNLRKAAENGRAAVAENARLARENLFLRAGINLDSKLGGMLFKTWEGDDIDALKAEATELGLFTPATPPAPAGATAEDAAQSEFREGLNTGRTPAGVQPNSPDPTDAALRGFHTSTKSGVRDEDARDTAFLEVLGAGVKGDKRVLYEPGQQRGQ